MSRRTLNGENMLLYTAVSIESDFSLMPEACKKEK